MKKRGFTLIELIGVIAILAAVALIAIPVVEKTLKSGKNRLYDDQINAIKLATSNLLSEQNINVKIDDGNVVMLTLFQLKLAGLIDSDITNPLTEKTFANDMEIKITKTNGILNIEVLEGTGTAVDNENMPYVEYLDYFYKELDYGTTYTDDPIYVYNNDVDYEEISVTVNNGIPSNHELNKIYQVTYNFTYNGDPYKIYKNVKVVDISAPRIIVPSEPLRLSLDEVNSYDFLAGVTASDNMNNPVIEVTKPRFTTKGTYTVKYTAKDSDGNIAIATRKVIVNNCAQLVNTQYAFNYKNAVQTFNAECPGRYKLEVWGAQGGNYSSYTGGKGGYSIGTVTLPENTNLYIHTGGTTTTVSGGYNGGGSGYVNGKGGGGATDIRIGTNSLYARVIVAGGGGGSGVYSSSSGYGYGGGTTGGDGYSSSNRSGNGGTQIAGGSTWSVNYPGTFGTGGSTGSGYSCGGGGAGWYGGGAAYDNDSDADGRNGGGGSGWVYTAANFNNWKSGNATDASKWLLNSNYYLTNASTTAGNASFTDPNGTTVTGHSGNGYARITYLGE